MSNVDKDAPKIRVGTARGEPRVSSANCELARPELQGRVPIEGHVMPTFAHNLMGICQFCDTDCIGTQHLGFLDNCQYRAQVCICPYLIIPHKWDIICQLLLPFSGAHYNINGTFWVIVSHFRLSTTIFLRKIH